MFIVQQQNSVTKHWVTLYEGDIDTAEKEYNSRVLDPHNIKFKHKFRWCQLSVMEKN